jgi:hypothetical protein
MDRKGLTRKALIRGFFGNSCERSPTLRIVLLSSKRVLYLCPSARCAGDVVGETFATASRELERRDDIIFENPSYLTTEHALYARRYR